jgi:hypothetical protein
MCTGVSIFDSLIATAQKIERPHCIGAGPEIGPTDPTGRSSGRDHRLFNGLARGDHNITFAVRQL